MKALDCCAGAGGLSIGLLRAGFDVLGVEIDAIACETHRAEVGPCDHASLWDYEPHTRFDLVAGGIPCQPHSVAGKRGGTGDPRGQLYVPFLRIAQQAGARAILIENVRGVLSSASATHGTSIREICAAVAASGYTHVARCVLNAADYGVPQTRHRLFLVAFVDGESLARFRWPEPSHSKHDDLRGLPRWVSIREALGLGSGDDAPAHNSALAFGSQGATTNPRRCGDRINPLLTELRRAGFSDRPATTIDTSGRLSAAGHHTTNKAGAVRLTLEQLALLQAFPLGFAFAGTKVQQRSQVGNAVPPPLAEAIARSLHAALK